jgi:hypothetical protein
MKALLRHTENDHCCPAASQWVSEPTQAPDSARMGSEFGSGRGKMVVRFEPEEFVIPIKVLHVD